MRSNTYKATLKLLTAAIRRRREELGLTQEDVADELGMVTRHLQKIEGGELNVTLRTLCRLADALRVTPDTLLRDQNVK